MHAVRHWMLRLGAMLWLCVLTQSARAERVQVEVCKELIENVFVPATFEDHFTCRDPAIGLCLGLPHCCVPVVCLAHPECTIASTVLAVAEHWTEQTSIVCEPEWQDPEAEFRKWLLGQIPSLDPVLVPGGLTALKAEILVMRGRAVSLPDSVKTIVRGAMASFWSVGTAKFAETDLNQVVIISNKDPLAKPYLFSGYSGITLGDLVILDDKIFKAVTETAWTSVDLKTDVAAAWAIHTVVHELVHVRQYRELGQDAFLKQYVLELIQNRGYSKTSSFELEAYEFADAVHSKEGWATFNPSVRASAPLTLSFEHSEFLLRRCMAKGPRPASSAESSNAAIRCFEPLKAVAEIRAGTSTPRFVQTKTGERRFLAVAKGKVEPLGVRNLSATPVVGRPMVPRTPAARTPTTTPVRASTGQPGSRPR